MTAPTPPVSVDTNNQLRRALTSLKDLRGRLEAVEQARHEPIAIIGMGCRFPGADSPRAYWELVRDGGDAITETPIDRWDTDGLFDADPEASGRVTTRWGGFLDHIDTFDASFFGIAPREAAQMDPQQRLLLECAWEALEDGGQSVEALAGSKTGVFVGVHSHSGDYYLMQAADPRHLDLYSGTGTSHSVVSGRLSYLLDLRGPSLAVDTVCSSSLVAVHLAVQSLRSGECSLALAGGVNTIIDPTFTIVASRMRMMSARGRCQPFDARADGFVRSEGCGVVVLKRLSDAVSDGDPVLAVINGSAVNQDGRSNGLTAPNSLSQQAVIGEALTDAGVSAQQIGMVEAHGTGTPLGDPIEVEALSAVFGDAGAAGSTCALGSAKANIGHTEGAAGVAALIKTVLTLRNGEVPPLVHFEELNPHIDLAGTPFVIPTTRRPWPAGDTPRYAGVSSFGWSGTNVHVIVGEAPAMDPAAAPVAADGPGPYLLPISARSADALHDLARAYLALLAAGPDVSLGDLCATAGRRRSHHEHRLAAVGRTGAELAAQLEAYIAGDESRGLAVSGGTVRRGDLVFVFPGQGAQWTGMARQLLASDPTFRTALESCERAFAAHVDWSLIELLTAADDRLGDIDVIQPTLFAIQVALAALWRQWGVEPNAVVGHSMGEVAAAHVAGILSLDDAASVICRRSLLLRRISGRGAMAVVDLPIERARQAIEGYEDRLAIAVSNSPSSTVLSGDPTAIDEVMEGLTRQEIFCRRVKVDVASHSPQVDELHDDLVAALASIRPQAGTTPFLSTVTARFEDGAGLDAEYWARNLRQPVQFAAAVRALLEDGHSRFVELGPHPLLLTAVEETLRLTDRDGATVASMQRDADEPVSMYAALGALYADGYRVDWRLVHPAPGRCAALPAYPWQRERHWIDVTDDASGRRRGRRTDPLLGWPVPLAGAAGVQVWENTLERADLPFLYEHRIGGVPSLPASALVELTTRAIGLGGDRSLADVRFERLAYLDDDEPTALQVVVEPGADGAGRVGVYSADGEGWMRHATATIIANPPPPPAMDVAAVTALQEHAVERLSGDEIYRQLESAGAVLGTGLRSISRLWIGDHEQVAAVVASSPDPGQSLLFDACLQAAALVARDDDGTRPLFMPVAADAVHVHGRPSALMTTRIRFRPDAAGPTAIADVVLYDETGGPIAAIDGLLLQRLDVARARPDDWYYRQEWQPVDARPVGRADGVTWLILADRGGVGEALAEQLRERGTRGIVVSAGSAPDGAGTDRRIVRPDSDDDLRLLLADVLRDATPVEVVYLWGLDGRGAASGGGALEQALEHSAGGLLRLTHALSATGRRAPVWVVTQGAQQVDGQDETVSAVQAPLWGLGRALAEELPELSGGLVDLDPAATATSAAAALTAELDEDLRHHEPEVARRGSRRLVARLARHAPAAAVPMRLRPDASYLVTGGFGALGTRVARWLIDHGARRLVLMGRTDLPPRREWSTLSADSPQGRRAATVVQLENLGVAVHVAAVDVGDESQVRAYLDRFREDGWPPIRGVVHAAAVAEGRLLTTLEPATFWEQLRPKVVGASVLGELLDDLDFFVLFSSIAAIVPQAGQAAYAAANAFLDALAQERATTGRAGLSINWGVWADGGDDLVGGERGHRRLEQMEARGFGGFRSEQGLDALGRLLQSGVSQAAFVPIDWSALTSMGTVPPPAVLAGLVEQMGAVDATDAPSSARVTSLPEQLRAAPADDRRTIIEAAVRRVLGRVLKLPEARIDAAQPFGMLGLDSLMAIELRNRLELELGTKLSATLAWNYPTITDLGAHLLAKLALPSDRGATAEAADETDATDAETPDPDEANTVQQMINAVDDLADDDVILALMGEAKR